MNDSGGPNSLVWVPVASGVSWVLDHVVSGMRRTMALCGRATVAELTFDLVSQELRSSPRVP
jgi:isopentenyl diphosphate isomerase/L-lactate dehydrogenase-like FMN-dependent dehydrogenase